MRVHHNSPIPSVQNVPHADKRFVAYNVYLGETEQCLLNEQRLKPETRGLVHVPGPIADYLDRILINELKKTIRRSSRNLEDAFYSRERQVVLRRFLQPRAPLMGPTNFIHISQHLKQLVQTHKVPPAAASPQALHDRYETIKRRYGIVHTTSDSSYMATRHNFCRKCLTYGCVFHQIPHYWPVMPESLPEYNSPNSPCPHIAAGEPLVQSLMSRRVRPRTKQDVCAAARAAPQLPQFCDFEMPKPTVSRSRNWSRGELEFLSIGLRASDGNVPLVAAVLGRDEESVFGMARDLCIFDESLVVQPPPGEPSDSSSVFSISDNSHDVNEGSGTESMRVPSPPVSESTWKDPFSGPPIFSRRAMQGLYLRSSRLAQTLLGRRKSPEDYNSVRSEATTRAVQRGKQQDEEKKRQKLRELLYYDQPPLIGGAPGERLVARGELPAFKSKEADSFKPLRSLPREGTEGDVSDFDKEGEFNYNSIAESVFCFHPGLPCHPDYCTCMQNNRPCQKGCSCWLGAQSLCLNHYVGCGHSNCSFNCTCYLLTRECDPDYCRCYQTASPSASSANSATPTPSGREPPEMLKKVRTPLFPPDMSIGCSMRRLMLNPALIGIAPSSIHGIGLFALDNIPKERIVGEYCGEYITSYETERRGLLADAMSASYIFSLVSHDQKETIDDAPSVDAGRLGSFVRWANNATNFNCETCVVELNQRKRVFFKSNRKIPATAEITISYNWEDKQKSKHGFRGISNTDGTAQKSKPKQRKKKKRKAGKKPAGKVQRSAITSPVGTSKPAAKATRPRPEPAPASAPGTTPAPAPNPAPATAPAAAGAVLTALSSAAAPVPAAAAAAVVVSTPAHGAPKSPATDVGVSESVVSTAPPSPKPAVQPFLSRPSEAALVRKLAAPLAPVTLSPPAAAVSPSSVSVAPRCGTAATPVPRARTPAPELKPAPTVFASAPVSPFASAAPTLPAPVPAPAPRPQAPHDL